MIETLAALTYPAIDPVAIQLEGRIGYGVLLAGAIALFGAWSTYRRFVPVPAKLKWLTGRSIVDEAKRARAKSQLVAGALALLAGAILYYGALRPFDPPRLALDIKWYGLAYMFGLLIGWQYVTYLLSRPTLWHANTPPMRAGLADDLLLWITLAVVLGGRLGQVLLYDPGYYFEHPAEIVKVWKGGMSFHGALIASGLAVVWFGRKYKVSWRSVMDLGCAGVPIGIVLGRIANFINSEHWGRETDAAIGMVFPNGGPLPRHPSQLYEAGLEGLVMAIIIVIAIHTFLALKRPGLVTGIFLVWYAIARSICEYFREPEPLHALNLGPITAGQVYSIPMLLLGLWFIATAVRNANANGTAQRAAL
jgi:phosphatidylglycerol:prolipoprotein diacylglycerol transferase